MLPLRLVATHHGPDLRLGEGPHDWPRWRSALQVRFLRWCPCVKDGYQPHRFVPYSGLAGTDAMERLKDGLSDLFAEAGLVCIFSHYAEGVPALETDSAPRRGWFRDPGLCGGAGHQVHGDNPD